MNVTTSTTTQFPKCRYCDGLIVHTPERCPHVVEVEYRRDGSVKRVRLGNRWAVPFLQPSPWQIGDLPTSYPQITYTTTPNICEAMT